MDLEWKHIEVPEPFMLNVLKHHKGAISAFVSSQRAPTPDAMRNAAKQLTILGSLVMDLYTGGLTVGDIAADISNELKKMHVFQESAYRKWITDAKRAYRNIDISDGSRWTLLWGRDCDRYIHIHPARYSRHSLRIKALPLKAAILLLLGEKGLSDARVLREINMIRTTYLSAAPIKDERGAKSTMRILKVLRS